MWIPLRSAKMNGRILGFQRRVWWPKVNAGLEAAAWKTVGTGMDLLLGLFSSAGPCPGTGRPRGCPAPDPKRGLARV